MTFWISILSTAVFVASSWRMLHDARRAFRGEDRPTIIPIVLFVISGEAMAILWLFVWGGK